MLRPGTAYAAVCSCLGRSCNCTDLCCDGYTEFCCQIYGKNSCPADTLLAGWWKVDNSSFCSGSARYYMDCNKRSPNCGCGSSGVCRGSDTTCQCRGCGNRKDGCTAFRYGNCNNDVKCVGPIMCRVVTCTKPWEIDPGCTTVARTDNNTRSHHRPCLEAPPREANHEERAFVEAIYADFLGRASDPDGRKYWGDIMVRHANQPGGGRDTVAYSFAFSAENANKVVTDLYLLALDRQPDPSGLAHWRGQILSGTGPSAVAVSVFGSEEFFQRAGSTHGGFVDRLFAKVLGRQPDPGGRAFWVEQLDAGRSRTFVAQQVYASEESRRRRVGALYQRFLARQPDPEGHDYWTNVIATREDVAVSLYLSASPEYYLKASDRFPAA